MFARTLCPLPLTLCAQVVVVVVVGRGWLVDCVGGGGGGRGGVGRAGVELWCSCALELGPQPLALSDCGCDECILVLVCADVW